MSTRPKSVHRAAQAIRLSLVLSPTHTLNHSRLRLREAGLYLLSVTAFFALFLLGQIGTLDTSEYGLLEHLQLAVLCLIGTLWLRNRHKLPACFMWGGVLLMIATIGREVSWLRIWGWHQPYGISVKLLWLSIITLGTLAVIRLWWQTGAERWRIILTYPFIYYYAAGTLWIALSMAFEESWIISTHPEYMEELCELGGYLSWLYGVRVNSPR